MFCITNLAVAIVRRQAIVRGYETVVSIFLVPDIAYNVNKYKVFLKKL